MLADEKTYETAHLAIGWSFDGESKAVMHLDGIIKRLDIYLVTKEGERYSFMINGKLSKILFT